MSELRIRLAIEYDVTTASEESERIVDEVLREESRRFTAAVTDHLERRGLDEIQLEIRGD